MSVEIKFDKIIDEITQIKVTLAAQHVTLKDHMRRTELLEKTVSLRNILGLCAAIAAIIESLHWAFK